MMNNDEILTNAQTDKIDEVKNLLYSEISSKEDIINSTAKLQDPVVIEGAYVQIKSEQAARERFVSNRLGIDNLDRISQSEIILALSLLNKEGAISRLNKKFPNASQIYEYINTDNELKKQLKIIKVCENNFEFFTKELLKKTRINNIFELLNNLSTQRLAELYKSTSQFLEQVKNSKKDNILSEPSLPKSLKETLELTNLGAAVTNKDLLEIINFLKNILVISGVLAQSKSANEDNIESGKDLCATLMFQLGYRPDFDKLF